MPLNVDVYDAGDTDYLAWMQRNPDGYVVNTERSANSRILNLHRANCSHISAGESYRSPDPYTKLRYIKVCALDPDQLIEWARRERPRAKHFTLICGSCKPDVESQPPVFPDEADVDQLSEGMTRKVTVNYVERSSVARKMCLDHYGATCTVCGVDFGSLYGDVGKGFIHVHHLDPLKGSTERREVNPIADLRPVCPNCHAMLHQKSPPIPIVELRRALRMTNWPVVDAI